MRPTPSHGANSLGLGELEASRFIPEGEFNSVPESEFVIDDAKVVLDDVLGGANLVGDVAIFESLGNEFNDSVFPFAGNPASVTIACKHSCLR